MLVAKRALQDTHGRDVTADRMGVNVIPGPDEILAKVQGVAHLRRQRDHFTCTMVLRIDSRGEWTHSAMSLQSALSSHFKSAPVPVPARHSLQTASNPKWGTV